MKSHPASMVVGMTLAALSAQAATISWNVYDITGEISDISKSGTPIVAHAGADLGMADDVDGTTFTINGVTFDDGFTLDTVSHTDTINARAGVSSGGPNSDYYTLLRYGDRQAKGDASITFTGLTIGKAYEIQAWYSDNNLYDDKNERMVLSNGLGAPNPETEGHASLKGTVRNNGPGQFALGRFVADSTSQSFGVRKWDDSVSPSRASDNTFINAYQLRDLGAGASATVTAAANQKEPAQIDPAPRPMVLPYGETVLISEDFEGATNHWSYEGKASRYEHGPGQDNYARTGSGAVMLPDANGSSSLVLSEPIRLRGMGARELFITFDYLWYDFGHAGSLFTLEYSPDNGKTWKKLDKVYTSEKQRGSAFVSLSSGLSDEALIRFHRQQETGQQYHAYIDNIIISAKR